MYMYINVYTYVCVHMPYWFCFYEDPWLIQMVRLIMWLQGERQTLHTHYKSSSWYPLNKVQERNRTLGLLYFPERKMRRYKNYLPSFRSDLPEAPQSFPVLASLWLGQLSVSLWCCGCSATCSGVIASRASERMFWLGKEKREEEDGDEEGQRKSSRGLTEDTESSELIGAQTRAVPWLFDCLLG